MSEQTQYETPYDYPLIVPLKDLDGNDITHINLQEPILTEIEAMSENAKKHNGLKAMYIMIANHSKQPVTVIQKMGARDLNRVQKYYDYFLNDADDTTSNT